MLREGFALLDPSLVGVYKIHENVGQRNDVITSAQRLFSERVLTLEDDIPIELHILFLLKVGAILILKAFGDSKVNQMQLVHI